MCYEIDVRSFSDADGDGTGDLEGLRNRLGYLELLGVDAIRLRPFYPSPMLADGNDTISLRAVDPLLGDLDVFDALVADTHECGLRLLLDLIPNHTSSSHTWFTEALATGTGSTERNRYHFLDGVSAESPPNNWHTIHGTPAWSRAHDGQWYLHLFGSELPELNWAHPEVQADFEKTLRFWLNRGIDGVHIQNAHALTAPNKYYDPIHNKIDPRFDNDGIHNIYRTIRAVIDTYPGVALWGDVPIDDPVRFGHYLNDNEFHFAGENRIRKALFDADTLYAEIARTLATVEPTGAPPVWTLGGPDRTHLVSHYGGGFRGLRRARAIALVKLGLPGLICLDSGEELGLSTRAPSRDGNHITFPWEGTGEEHTPSAEIQLEDENSTLSLYRKAIELRQEHAAFNGDGLEWYGAPPGCFAYRRSPGGLVCVLNTSAAPVPLPRGDLLLSSAPLIEGKLPPDATAWLA